LFSQSSYLINIYAYSFLFTLSYILPMFNDVFFMVSFSRKSEKAIGEVISYREFFIDISIVFFIISTLLLYFADDIFYLTSLITIYITLILFKYYKGNREILKLRLYENEAPLKAPSYFINLKYYHYSLHLFTVFYMLFAVKSFENKNPLNFKSYHYLNPVTALFLCGLFLGVYLFIKKAPDFAEKKVKPMLLNYLYLVSYTIIFTLLVITDIMISFNYIRLIYEALFLFILIFLNIIYILYLKTINKPYDFKIENSKINSSKIIDTSLDGTRIFLNLKNKKARLISAGFVLYVLIYISLVYLLAI